MGRSVALRGKLSWDRSASNRILRERAYCQQNFHPNGYHAPSHAHFGTEVIYSEHGRGTFLLNGTEYMMMPGSVLIFPAQLPHRASITRDYMRWNLCALPNFFDDPKLSRSIIYEQLASPAEENVRSIFENIAGELSGQQKHMDQYVQLLIKQLVLWLERGSSNRPLVTPGSSRTDSPDSLLSELTSYIEGHLQDDLSVQHLATAFNYSRSQIWRIINSATGQSPVEYITDLRVKRASFLLRQTNQPIASIAHRSGFGSPAYFSRVFRDKVGCTPREYRESSGRSAPAFN